MIKEKSKNVYEIEKEGKMNPQKVVLPDKHKV
jgi:hypothetical protein